MTRRKIFPCTGNKTTLAEWAIKGKRKWEERYLANQPIKLLIIPIPIRRIALPGSLAPRHREKGQKQDNQEIGVFSNNHHTKVVVYAKEKLLVLPIPISKFTGA